MFIESALYVLVTVDEAMAWLPSPHMVPPGMYGPRGVNQTQFWKLNIESNTWTQLEIPHSPSKCFHLINVGHYIYAIGIAGTLERISTEQDKWFACSLASTLIAYFDTV